MRMLTVEKPGEEIQYMPWEEDAKRKFQLSQYEVESLEKGKVVWRGEQAFCVDEEE